MVIPRVWALLSAICAKFSLFFASSLKVRVQNATNGYTQGLGTIVCYLSESFAVFCQQFQGSFLKCYKWLYLGLWQYCLLFVPKFPCILLLDLRLASGMPRIVVGRVWALSSAICPKVSLFFASSFKVDFQNATNGDTQGLGPIVFWLSQSFAVFLLVVLRLTS